MEKFCFLKKLVQLTLAYFSTRINSARAERPLSNRDCNGECQQQLLRSCKKSKKNLGIGWPASLEKAGKQMPCRPPLFYRQFISRELLRPTSTRQPRNYNRSYSITNKAMTKNSLYYLIKIHRRFTIA